VEYAWLTCGLKTFAMVVGAKTGLNQIPDQTVPLKIANY
jgi:hypothetical protein